MDSCQEIIESFNLEAIVIFCHYQSYMNIASKQKFETYAY